MSAAMNLWVVMILLIAILVVSWVNKSHLNMGEIDKYNTDQFVKLSTQLTFRLSISFFLMLSIGLSPFFAYHYPLIVSVAPTFPFGEVYAIAAVLVATIAAFNLIIFEDEAAHGKFRKFGSFLEKCLIAGLSSHNRRIYECHGHWRWIVLELRISRWCQRKGSISIHNRRITLLLIAASISMALCIWLFGGLATLIDRSSGSVLERLIAQPSAWNPLLIILGMPIAFMVWLFRDQNNREQIENQRKDINLKDFQKNAEWAAGTHFVEDKIVETKKAVKSMNSDASVSSTDESVTSKESYGLPEDAVLPAPGRRDAAAALQIAAVHQLAAFLRGDFGVHFQRPAFQLFRSIWLVLMQVHVNRFPRFPYRDQADLLAQQKDWLDGAQLSIGRGLGEALTLVLGSDRGQVLRNHSHDLSNIVLAGFDTQLPALENQKIRQGIDLEGLRLRGAQLHGSNFYLANLQRVDFFQAQLQGTNLQMSSLQEAELALAQLDGADISGARMQGAKLGSASLFGTKAFVTDLRHAILHGTDLRCAQLNGAKLEGALLVNIHINEATSFAGATIDENTQICVATQKSGTYGLDISTFPKNCVIDEVASRDLRDSLASRGLDMTLYRGVVK
ncbi:hypothetical protein GJ700_21655 [Duganella sp. FT92W]|uniref:Pentapeptide repeat-containing protein n=1 Tax=Pseudoduganella rivuli TaxID=2666085 RepID=A0A7X2IQI4_9BURK|nr:pentapeptide repeat-containing protein [Pseudoduganella rivuli]MRV74316.1 hypothetical protein [Pseudoduganella rivuli]